MKLRRRRRPAVVVHDPIISTILLACQWTGDAEGLSVKLHLDHDAEVVVRNGDQATTWSIKSVRVEPWGDES